MPNIKSTFDEIIYACIQRDQKARKELLVEIPFSF